MLLARQFRSPILVLLVAAALLVIFGRHALIATRAERGRRSWRAYPK